MYFTDGCKKSAIVFDDAISAVEFINCQSVQAQVGDSSDITSSSMLVVFI